MFHLLTTFTETGTFRRHQLPGRELRYDLVQARAESPCPDPSAPALDSRPVLGIGAAPARASLSYKPMLCCGALGLALLISVVAEPAFAQAVTPASSREAKIANALSAAPDEVARNAAVKDWPSKEGEGLVLLRQGTNGWVCLPNDPATPGNDPMCMDATFHDALSAYVAGQVSKVTRVGYAYMLTSDAEGSNISPRETKPTPTNQWHHAGPHVMVLFPDAKLLEGLPTKPSEYGPYVMFPGTPVAHVMLPVASGYAHAGGHSAKSPTGDKRR